MLHKLMIATILATATLPGGAQASVRSGIEAWQNGEHGKAVAIWRSLADKGDQDAAFNLGQAYRLGKGVAADSGEAKKWFEKAARAGHLDAQVSLGLLLFDIGDRATSLMWLKRAADRGEARAMLVTGTALFNGDGMKRDPILGYAYVSRAAAQGLGPAKATLADMDKVMPVEDRKKGVALALAAATTNPAPTTNQTAATKPAAVAARPAIPAKTAKPVASATPKKAAPPIAVAPSGGWRIQLGAFGNRGAAQALFGRLRPSLGGAQAYYIPVGAMTRLQAGPFASRAAATETCARLKPQPCFPVSAK
ncbi:MAG TPA: SPOR domain-containing protein [Sphingomicrobium sp.]|nr:SPOR domain-containing protein [Sphingomicrobium sp.]